MRKQGEVKIKRKFAYTVSDDALKNLPLHPPLDGNRVENNKKQFNKMPNNRRNNNLVVIEPGTRADLISCKKNHWPFPTKIIGRSQSHRHRFH